VFTQPSHRVWPGRRPPPSHRHRTKGIGSVGDGFHLAGRDVVVLAVVLDPPSFPQGPQCRDHLVQPFSPGPEVLTGLDVLSSHQPTPTPSVTRLWESTAAVPTDLATVMRSRDGSDVDAGGEPQVGGGRGERRDRHIDRARPSLLQNGDPSGAFE